MENVPEGYRLTILDPEGYLLLDFDLGGYNLDKAFAQADLVNAIKGVFIAPLVADKGKPVAGG